MCEEKTIKLSLEQAKKMYGKSPEMDELLLANFSKEELTKKELPKSWIELIPVNGHTISTSGNGTTNKTYTSGRIDKSVFATEKQAKSALAMAQLSQLMAVYNDGWEFKPNSTIKNSGYVLLRLEGRIHRDYFCSQYQFLAFKSAELRNEFLLNFEPLIKEYFMID